MLKTLSVPNTAMAKDARICLPRFLRIKFDATAESERIVQ